MLYIGLYFTLGESSLFKWPQVNKLNNENLQKSSSDESLA